MNQPMRVTIENIPYKEFLELNRAMTAGTHVHLFGHEFVVVYLETNLQHRRAEFLQVIPVATVREVFPVPQALK